MTELKLLIGKVIKSIDMPECNEGITFHTTIGSLWFVCDADCCSESWINHISGIECLWDEIVTDVEEIEMPSIFEGQEGHSGKQEEDIVLMYRLKTSKGTCDIEFRNSSNGYYGGNLSFICIEDTSDEVRNSGTIRDNF